MIKKAMILAAGFGKRLNPLTLDCPKPLLKIGRETLLSNTINFLEQYQIKEIIINVHYLGEQISEYLNKRNFNININIINEKEKILNTGGGILNVSKYFNESFLCINPDTIWNSQYIGELKKMESEFISNKRKNILLVVDRGKSFDKNLKGDFNIENGLIKIEKNKDLKYVYTGLQIIDPKVFLNVNEEVFPINKIWDNLIEKSELFALKSNIDFQHVSNLDIYKKLNIK